MSLQPTYRCNYLHSVTKCKEIFNVIPEYSPTVPSCEEVTLLFLFKCDSKRAHPHFSVTQSAQSNFTCTLTACMNSGVWMWIDKIILHAQTERIF